MADDVHQPHDKLFRAIFSDAGEAASLLQASFPDTLRNRLDWTTLTLHDGTFVDDDLRGRPVRPALPCPACRNARTGFPIPALRAPVVAGPLDAFPAPEILLSYLGGRHPG